MCCVSWLLVVGGVGVCFAGGSGGGALTNVYTGLIIHTDSPPPSYTYTNYTATTHLYIVYTSDPGLPANTRNQVVRLPNCQGSGYQLDMGTRLLKVTCHIQNKKQVAWVGGTKSWRSGRLVIHVQKRQWSNGKISQCLWILQLFEWNWRVKYTPSHGIFSFFCSVHCTMAPLVHHRHHNHHRLYAQ